MPVESGRMRFLIIAALLAQLACANPVEPVSNRAAADNSPSTVTVVTGRAPAGALITLEPTAGTPLMPAGPAVMDQFSKAFIPDTLFVRVGQAVVFKNSDDQLHNVTVVRSRTGAGVLNISQSQGDVHTQQFDQPGEYNVSCDVHPGMVATLIATTTPHAVYSRPSGTFEVPNVAPGPYTLRVSAGGRVTERAIDIAGRQMEVGDATLAR